MLANLRRHHGADRIARPCATVTSGAHGRAGARGTLETLQDGDFCGTPLSGDTRLKPSLSLMEPSGIVPT